MLFSREELLAATKGEARHLDIDGIDAISIDSRDLGSKTLFVAIAGDRFDGHDFVHTAFANGAAAALVSADKAPSETDNLVVVSDALQGLRDLATAARARSSARIIAVTGSVGKTTTKEAIRLIFEAAGRTHASIKSFNNHWGVPLMLARMPRDTEYAVFELGMNHSGEITPLSQLVQPEIAIITNVAAAHLEFFSSVADIARAKAEIFDGLVPGGIAVLNADHDHLPILREAANQAGVAQIITYGFVPDVDWRITDYTISGGTTSITIAEQGQTHTLILQVQGRHMAANALAAFIAARLCGIDASVAISALEKFSAPEGRGAAISLGDPAKPLLVIDESYNANVASVLAALEVFGTQTAPDGRKILVLGDMRELGEHSRALHVGLRDGVLRAGADAVYLVGPHMLVLAEALGPTIVAAHTQTAPEMGELLVNSLAYGDIIMVKGSNGVRLAGLIETIRSRF